MVISSSQVRIDGGGVFEECRGASQNDAVSGIAGGVATRFAVGHTSAGRGLEYGKTKNSLSPHKSDP